jgi:hypothetical protein
MPRIGVSPTGECCVLCENGDVSLKHVGDFMVMENYIQSVQLKSGPYFDMSNLFIKIYNTLYYTTNLYLQ